jgi:hypothetical protein
MQDGGDGQDRGDAEGVPGGKPPFGLQGAADDDPEASEAEEPCEPEPGEGVADHRNG